MKKNDSNKEQDSYEKLRDELFDYRVKITSYIRSLNYLIIAGTIVLTILGFFGYNKIENIEKIILNRVNERLSVTDSLLAKIDQKKLDSLNALLQDKEIEYKTIINNFEFILRQNDELESKFLNSMPVNEIPRPSIESYLVETQSDIFALKLIKESVKIGEELNIFLIFNESIDLNEVLWLGLQIFTDDQKILLVDKFFKVNSRFNRMSVTIDNRFEQNVDYSLQAGFYKEYGKDYRFYRTTRTIRIN